MITLAGHMHWCKPILRLGRYWCAALEHHVHYVLMAGPGGTVEGCQAVSRASFKIRPLVQQQTHHVPLAPLGSHVQRRDVMLCRVIDIGSPLKENNGDALVAVVGGNVERGEPGLAGDIRVVVVLEQEGGRLRVVLLGRDVQSGQTDLASCVILQKHCDHLVMTLLQGNSEGCEAVLRGKGLAGSRGEQEPNLLVMVLLSRHVEW